MYTTICETDRQSSMPETGRSGRTGGRWEGGSGWGTHVHPC